MEKRIETVELKVKDLKTGFGNPRKIRKKQREELQASLEYYGDFGLILVDEHDNIIAGNQRVSILKDMDPETVVLCKRLIGYTEAELKAINIKDNVHAGEWDLDALADWTSDIVVDLGIETPPSDPEERKIKDMELIRYEKYDYVLLVCRNEVDYLNLQRLLGIDNGKVLITNKRRIKARAVWFDDIKAQIVPKE